MARSRSMGPVWLVSALVLAGCDRLHRLGEARAEPPREYDEQRRILSVTAEDEQMNAAVARARATVGEFLPRLRHPSRGLSYMGVKVRLADTQKGEHIWLYDLRLENGRIAGRLVDDAERFPDWKRGDEVRVEPGEISDWMTVENGRACGGFTSRVMVAQMNAEQRAAWLREMEIERLPPGGAVCDEGESGTP
ncbi:MAG: DUF2314 domain-containing protein [Longimicrobiaceae bacterium]